MPHHDISVRDQRAATSGSAQPRSRAPPRSAGAPARAQPATPCVVGTWGGDYQNLLEANIVKPLLEPQGRHGAMGRRRAGRRARTS